LKGRVKYHNSLKKSGQSSTLLRRNIHRLEKGLIMRPRRDCFAEGFILETVVCYLKCRNDNGYCHEELKWAKDTLSTYFNVVVSTIIIDKAKNIFSEANYKNNESTCEDEQLYSPYFKRDSVVSKVNFEQLDTLFRQRRSVRWFEQRTVPMELIDKAVNIAKQAPSACNRLPYKFLVSHQADIACKIAECAMGTQGFSGNIQCLVTVIGDLSAYPAERDRHVIYIDAALASMQLMLAFETLGLSSCPINWPDIEERERRISKLLELDYTQRPVMLIAVGYADPNGGIPYSLKKKNQYLVEEVINVN
jgi:nitroreductase